MKKTLILAAAATSLLFTACATTEFADKKSFNNLEITSGSQAAFSHADMEMWGLYFLGIPLITPDLQAKDWGVLLFTDNITTENAIEMTTRNAKSHGATQLDNVTSLRQSTFFWGFMIYECHVSANAIKPVPVQLKK